MIRFQYKKAVSLEEAFEFLSQHADKTRIMAGGTDLMIDIREKTAYVKDMEYVYDISGLKCLSGVREKSGIVTIGALTTHAEIHKSPLIQEAAPLLARACSLIGGPQTRVRGTVGGNICNASPCADSAAALVALDALVTLTSPKGSRQMPICDFLPGKDIFEPGEILTEISFVRLKQNETSSFVKLGRRKALAISRMSTSAILEWEDSVVKNARIAVGAAFPVHRRMKNAEKEIIGKKPDEMIIAAAGRQAALEMLEITGVRWSTEYKEPVLQTMVERCIQEALMVK
jgi:carbon-monoxide dehydrogenase medium subunit/xanthine dehydrogenase FAD-binding subunit